MPRTMSQLPFHLPPDDCPSRVPGQADWEVVSRRLGRIAQALTRRGDEADDLVQQTIAALLAKSPEKADHFGYARQTLVRLWMDRQRSLRRRFALLARRAAGASGFFVHRDEVEDSEQVERARAAVEELPARQRAVFVLRVIEELDYPQIADELGCDVGSVRANLHLARARVRKALGEEP